MEGTAPVIVSSDLRECYYEFIRELNDRCQLDFTPREIIALVDQVDYVPENCERSSPTNNLDEQNDVENALHSVIQVDSSQRGDTSTYGVCTNDGTEKQHKNSASSSPQSQSANLRSLLVKPERSCLMVKLTSREHLALRHCNKAEGCIEELNSFLSTSNVQIYLSNKKPRLVVKGNCDFDLFSGSLLTLIHRAGYSWDHRKDKNQSKTSLQLLKETKSCSTTQLFNATSAPNSEELATNGSANKHVNISEDANRLTENAEAVRSDWTSQPTCEKTQIENFFMPDTSPEELLVQQCPHLCKDFPDCDNTNPDRIVSNSCEVVYMRQNSQHDLFISADPQFDIVKRLNLRFEGVRISLLRKFPAIHVLPPEGVNRHIAIKAIRKLLDRCSSLPDIAKELRDMRNQLYVNNSDAPTPMIPSVRQATEYSTAIATL